MTAASARGDAAGGRCILAAVIVVAADQLTKLAAVAMLDDAHVPLAGDAFLTLVYNDTFARGLVLGAATLPATLLLATAMLLLVTRACAPLAAVDRSAPVALGLVAGATIGNAGDFLHTGRGAVDFIGWPSAGGAVVFNVADVAAYAGVAILARTAWRLTVMVRAERRAAAAQRRAELAAVLTPPAQRTAARDTEIALPVPLFVEPDVRERVPAGDPGASIEVPPARTRPSSAAHALALHPEPPHAAPAVHAPPPAPPGGDE